MNYAETVYPLFLSKGKTLKRTPLLKSFLLLEYNINPFPWNFALNKSLSMMDTAVLPCEKMCLYIEYLHV